MNPIKWLKFVVAEDKEEKRQLHVMGEIPPNKTGHRSSRSPATASIGSSSVLHQGPPVQRH
jgi:hypothetical protein